MTIAAIAYGIIVIDRLLCKKMFVFKGRFKLKMQGPLKKLIV